MLPFKRYGIYRKTGESEYARVGHGRWCFLSRRRALQRARQLGAQYTVFKFKPFQLMPMTLCKTKS